MRTGGRTGSKCSGTGSQQVRMKSIESEGSDEDYVAEIEEIDDQSDELISLVGDASEEESCFEAEEEEEEEEDEGGWRRVVKTRARKGKEDEGGWRSVVKTRAKKEPKRRRKKEIDDQSDELISLVGDASEEESCFEAEEEEEEEEDEGGWRRVVKTRARKGKEDEGGWRSVVKTRAKKEPKRRRKNGMKRCKRIRRIRSDDEEDSDDDDEEFTPEEEYLEEEEEDLEEEEEEEGEEEYCLLETNTRKRGRTAVKKNSSVKSQRKRRVKAARKPCPKKRKKPSSLRRRTKSDGDEDFIGKGPTLRGRSRKNPARRKKQVTAGSESDFCSNSSDYEFTISEEEREQIREANMICGSLGPNLRSSRRIQEDDTFYEPTKAPARKGKAKEEGKKKEAGKPVCGICLTEEGKNTVRGSLNCCSHYFCFACIFEWSKVETRCPLCKQRFVSISKPARCGKGFDLRDTVIPVPERDQVYQPSEEELRDFLNPYENVICTECHHGGDDALMLLCDLCDSPAHTYCVGLGREVPVGNWYCEGCRPAALGSSHSQIQDLTPDRTSSTGVPVGTSTYENMAEIDLNVTIPETPVSQGIGFLSSPRFSGGSFQAPSPASGMGVSTVSGRRRIHRQIHHILSNRLSQISPEANISALGNLTGRGVNSTQQQNRTTDVGPSHHAQYVDRLQEIPSISVQNRNSFPGRMGHMVRQIGQPSTSANSSVHGQIHCSGLDRLSLGEDLSQITAGEQLCPCTGRSSTGTEIGMSPSQIGYGEHANFVDQQVHSMVRSQLKSLSRDMNLGHNDYVDISKRSAQTIMAAYGLEPRRHDTYEAQPPICLHFDSRLGNVETSPMNGCCLACFEAFVKDVVKRIMDIVVQPHWFRFGH